MAYDEELSRPIRQLIGSDPELTEKMWKNRYRASAGLGQALPRRLVPG
jgi:hypothetical protein